MGDMPTEEGDEVRHAGRLSCLKAQCENADREDEVSHACKGWERKERQGNGKIFYPSFLPPQRKLQMQKWEGKCKGLALQKISHSCGCWWVK